MSILLDTGVLFAFLNDRDQRHDQAMDLMQAVWSGKYGTPIVSTWIVDELWTLARAKKLEPAMERAIYEMLVSQDPALSGVRVIDVGPMRLHAVWSAFEKYRDQGLSATDASHVVLMAEHGIDVLATFDKRLTSLVSSISEA